MKKIVRSPFFYVGDKYKLMTQLLKIFPDNIDTFIEPFVGGGSVFLNTSAKNYQVNDLETNIIDLHKMMYSYKNKKEKLFNNLYETIDSYKLSCSFRNITVPDELKKEYVKTYYAHYNREGYLKLREDYNDSYNVELLYILLIYGFNHMIRFNRSGKFNLPVGNVDFNNNVYQAIDNYLDFVSSNKIKYHNLDYIEFIKKMNIKENDFVYFDPPYLLSNSEYNKMWDLEKEKELYDLIDDLDSRGIKFGISNLLIRNEEENETLLNWMDKYYVYDIKSNYISYHDNTIKNSNKEVYITNVKKT